MRSSPQHEPPLDHLIPLILLAVLLFASPFVYWWANAQNAWYIPYLLWLLVIALGGRLFRRGDRREP